MLRPVSGANHALNPVLFAKATERIRTSPACNFPLTYAPMHGEWARFQHLVEADPRNAAVYAKQCGDWLQAIVDASEPDLVRMVQRNQKAIEKPGEMAAAMSAQALTQAAHSQLPRLSPAEFVAGLARRGIIVEADNKGGLKVHPSKLLTEGDRGVLRGMKADIAAALRADMEVF
jgi:hypothetical protein